MDQNGEADGNYTLLAMQVINDSIEMKIVGSFQQTDHEIPVLNLVDKLNFYGNGPPKSEPDCGFNNELCDNGLSIVVITMITTSLLLLMMCVSFIFKYGNLLIIYLTLTSIILTF